jgi:hypothetical protein
MHFSLFLALIMEHPIVQLAGIFVIRSIPKILLAIGAFLVLKKVLLEVAN